MALTFATMKTELLARGFDSLDSTRQGYYINAGRAELDRMFLWPWREKSATGTGPLTITDLGTVEAVLDTSNFSTPLARMDYRTLVENFGDLSLAGSPSYYYVAWPSGVPQVAVYPTSTHTIGVQYWKVTPDLTGTQAPLCPDEFQYTIIDLAVRRAYRDLDDHASAAALQPEIDNAVSQMLQAYPPGQADGPDAYVGYTGASVDG